MDVAYDWNRLTPPKSLREFEARWSNRLNPLDFSGVWRSAGPDYAVLPEQNAAKFTPEAARGLEY